MNNTTLKFPVKSLTGVLILVVGALVLAYGAWLWCFCRFYVDVGQMAIVTSKDGTELPPGQILAKRGQKGIWEEPLAEGRHFLNPIVYDWKIVPAVRIPAGRLGIVTAKDGKDLPQGEFLAEAGQKGVWRRVLGPGTYRLNPEGYNVNLVDAVNIPIGYVGVVTSLSGDKAPEGQFAGPRQKGVRSDILQPGLYYINANAFKIDVLEVGVNQVTLNGKEGSQVLTKSKMDVQNDAMDALAGNLLAEQQKRREDYIEHQAQQGGGSFASRWNVGNESSSDVAANAKPHSQSGVVGGRKTESAAKAPQAQSALAGKDKAQANKPAGSAGTFGMAQFVEFPSRDGFEIRLDMTVEFELLPEKIAEIYLHYGDLPAVVDKIIMPQIQSVSRLKGSSYRAQDFIVGEGREKFQNELKDTLAAILKEKNIVVHNSLIRHVEVPEQILAPIQQASLAVEQNLTNIARQNTARKQAELNTAETLIEQRRQEVAQETEKLVGELNANKEKEVAEIRATTDKLVATIALETAATRAVVTRTLGEAKARVTTLVEGEKARGFELRIKAIGDPAALSLLSFSDALNPGLNLNVIHAGPGTLWTDLKNATLGDLGGAKQMGTK